MDPSNEMREDHGSSTDNADDAHYQRLRLGLVMNLAYRFCRNWRIAALTAIYLTIFTNTLDTTSDILCFVFYLSQGLTILAVSVALSDYIPGILVLAHHYNSADWTQSSVIQKGWAVISLVLHPFSALVTNVGWLFNITSLPHHRLARISTILHGAVEAPVQFIILLFVYSKAILPIPWAHSTNVVDSRGNVLVLGKISLFSLILTCIGLLKASCETFELVSIKDQIFASMYALINLVFRITSIAYILTYFEIFSIPFFLSILLVNYLTLLYNNESNRRWASSTSSFAVSVFMPICISSAPEEFQILVEESTDVDTEGNDERRLKKKEEIYARKRCSVFLAVYGNTAIILMDAVVFIVLEFSQFVQDTVWTNTQMKQTFTRFLLPLYFLSLIVTLAFSHIYEKEKPNNNFCDRIVQKIWRRTKSILSVLALTGFIVVGVIYGLTVEKLTRSAIVYVNPLNELTVVQLISNGPIQGCDYDKIPTPCTNVTINPSNFRNQTQMENGAAYLQRKSGDMINTTNILNRGNHMFDLLSIGFWKKDAPEVLKKAQCKRCLTDSITCNSLMDSIQGINRCDDGKLTLF